MALRRKLRWARRVPRVAMDRVAEVVLPVVEDVAADPAAADVADRAAAAVEALAAVVAGVGARIWFCSEGDAIASPSFCCPCRACAHLAQHLPWMNKI